MARFFSLSLIAAFSFGALSASAFAQDEAPPLVQLLGQWELVDGDCSQTYGFAMHGDDVAWNTVFHGENRANDLHVSVNGDRVVASNNQHSFAPHGDALAVYFGDQQICTFRREGAAAPDAASTPAPDETPAAPAQTPVVEPPADPPPDSEPTLPATTQVSALEHLLGRWEWEGGQCSQTYVFELEGDALRWTTINRGRDYPVNPPFSVDGEHIVLDDGHSFAPRGDQLFVLMNGQPVCMFRRAA